MDTQGPHFSPSPLGMEPGLRVLFFAPREVGRGTHVATSLGMEHAASADTDAAYEPMTVCVCLRRGSAAQSTWFLEDVSGGTTISVGADPACDWQVRAACVSAHAISMLLLSGTLFVRSTCQGDVLLDGAPLGDAWVVVPDFACIDIGLAQLEVTRRPVESSGLQRTVPVTLDTPRQERRPQVSMATQAEFGVVAPAALQVPVWADPALGSLTDRPSAPAFERPSRMGLFAPSLLGDDEPDRASGWWLYVVATLATLLAYGTWVVVLDGF
jgi:hypothetical protein